MGNLKTKKQLYDFIIVGGGIAGLSCTYWIKKLKPNAKVAIVEKGKIQSYDPEKQFCNLTVGSLNYLYRLYKIKGIEAVLSTIKEIEDNINLIEDELHVIDKNPYVSLYDGGTINLMEEGDARELGFFQSFVYELSKYDFPIKEVKNKNWQYGVKFSHDGNYESRKFIDKICSCLKKDVDIYEQSTCKMIGRGLDDVTISTAGGDEIMGKKIILANSNSLTQLLPELKEEVSTVDGFIYKFDSEVNNLELVNYANHNSDGYFVKLVDGYYYAKHGNMSADRSKSLTDHEASKSFDYFSKKVFPGAEAESSVKTKIAYTTNGLPVKGRSKRNPYLFYLGGFSGQSKFFAFKLAKELVEESMKA